VVCYIIPTACAVILYALRRGKRQGDANLYRLNLLLLGGAVFGVVDHLWNGELILIGPNPAMDILLGATITLAIFCVWLAIVAVSKATEQTKAVG